MVGEELVRRLLRGDETIEVKRDFRVSNSGNIAIEREGLRGRKSGIASTTAEWWAFILDGYNFESEVIIFIKTARLKTLVELFANETRTKGHKLMGGYGVFNLLPLYRIFTSNYDIQKQRDSSALCLKNFTPSRHRAGSAAARKDTKTQGDAQSATTTGNARVREGRKSGRG